MMIQATAPKQSAPIPFDNRNTVHQSSLDRLSDGKQHIRINPAKNSMKSNPTLIVNIVLRLIVLFVLVDNIRYKYGVGFDFLRRCFHFHTPMFRRNNDVLSVQHQFCNQNQCTRNAGEQQIYGIELAIVLNIFDFC